MVDRGEQRSESSEEREYSRGLQSGGLQSGLRFGKVIAM
jgi:hypothetical protein